MGDDAEEPTPDEVEPKTGSGKFIFPDKSVYEGEWMAGADGVMKRHGTGTYQSGENKYTGEWCEDAMQGTGTFKYASGSTYEGEWTGNQYMGEGKYTWPDGSSYTGGWADNKFHGKGTYVDAQGEIWEGDFYNGNSGSADFPELPLLNIQ